MKLLKNQRGAADIPLIALAVVLVLAAGIVAWRIQETDKAVNNSAVATQAGSESKNGSMEPAFGTLEYPNFSLTFDHPAKWGASFKNMNEILLNDSSNEQIDVVISDTTGFYEPDSKEAESEIGDVIVFNAMRWKKAMFTT